MPIVDISAAVLLIREALFVENNLHNFNRLRWRLGEDPLLDRSDGGIA